MNVTLTPITEGISGATAASIILNNDTQINNARRADSECRSISTGISLVDYVGGAAQVLNSSVSAIANRYTVLYTGADITKYGWYVFRTNSAVFSHNCNVYNDPAAAPTAKTVAPNIIVAIANDNSSVYLINSANNRFGRYTVDGRDLAFTEIAVSYLNTNIIIDSRGISARHVTTGDEVLLLSIADLATNGASACLGWYSAKAATITGEIMPITNEVFGVSSKTAASLLGISANRRLAEYPISNLYGVIASLDFKNVSGVLKDVGDRVSFIGNDSTYFDFYYAPVTAPATIYVEIAIVGGAVGWSNNVILATNGTDSCLIASGTTVRIFNRVTGVITDFKTVSINLTSGLFQMDYRADGIYISNVALTTFELLATSAELATLGFTPALGISSNRTTEISFYYAYPTQQTYKELGAFDGAQMVVSNGRAYRKEVKGKFVFYGDSIMSEYWIADARRKVLLSQATFKLGKQPADVVTFGYPDRTFSSEHVSIIAGISTIIAAAPNVLILAAGTNDFGYSTTIGTVDSTSLNTMAGGMNKVLGDIKTALPYCTIFVCTPIPRQTQNVPNTQGKILLDYVKMVREVAEKYSCPIIDLYARSNFYFGNEGAVHAYLFDGIHPTPLGYDRMTSIICNDVKNYF